jgi:hypothetical protein
MAAYDQPSASLPAQPVSTVWDPGVFADFDLGSSTHVQRTVPGFFVALCQLHHLCWYVTDDCFQSLLWLLVYLRLNYGSFLLVG